MSSTETKSESLRFREQGNARYSLANVAGLSPCLVKSRLQSAIAYYQQAKSSSLNQDEKVSASKNIGIASKRIALLTRNDCKKELKYHFSEALLNFDLAYEFSSCKGVDWKEGLMRNFHETVEEIVTKYTAPNAFDFEYMISALDSFTPNIKYNNHFRCELLVRIAKLIFQEGITQLSVKNFRKCLYQMKECYKPVKEAEKYGHSLEHVITEVRVLQQDIYLHECIARSHQARCEGDQLLEKYIHHDDTLNMGMVWTVIDLYKEAIILTRENDMEAEAMALSRLGSIFHKVMKDKWKAKPYFMRSIQLAMSLHPRTFDLEGWFREAKATLEKYQEEVIQQEDKIWNEERKPYLKELKDDLEIIAAKRKEGKAALLTYIYKTYPPRWKKVELGELPKDGSVGSGALWKSIFKKAIIHYHQDKVDVVKEGVKWKVLCEEIVKILTALYEYLK